MLGKKISQKVGLFKLGSTNNTPPKKKTILLMFHIYMTMTTLRAKLKSRFEYKVRASSAT